MKIAGFLFLLCPIAYLSAMEIGNPAIPCLQKKGVIIEKPRDWSFRVAYLDDYVYRMRFKDEFEMLITYSEVPTFIKLATNAAIVTLNFFDRIDAYAILGTSQFQLGQEVFTKREFAWGVGGKILIAKVAKISFGTDLKFFTTLQRPLYFFEPLAPDPNGRTRSSAYNVKDAYRMSYWEIQGAFGASYRTKLVSPYLHITYLISKIEPTPWDVDLQDPDDAFSSINVPTKSFIIEHRWGMAVGATLLGSPKASLTVEARFINQNAIDINGELRF